jgi:hypothetical protein
MTALAIIAAYPLMVIVTLAGMVATACIWGDPWQKPTKKLPSKSSSNWRFPFAGTRQI